MSKKLMLRAMRLKCLDCVCQQTKEVRLCPTTYCPLYPYRMGEDPFKKRRVLTPDQKLERRARLVSKKKTDTDTTPLTDE